jgi:hypothetical protein
MKRVLITLFVLVAALSVASITLAQSEPAQTPTENACYAGGEWDGKCDWPTEAEDNWAWTCGWYYARVIDGRIGAAQAPETCKFVAEQEPVDPVDPEVCAPQDDTYTFYEEVPVGPSPGYLYTIPAPGVLANDGPCKGVFDRTEISSSNMIYLEVSSSGSIEVAFTDIPAYAEFSYETKEGLTANIRIDLFAIAVVDPVVCAAEGDWSICIEGDSYDLNRVDYTVITKGDLDAVGSWELCATLMMTEVNYLNAQYQSVSELFPTNFPDDDRKMCFLAEPIPLN